MERLSKNNQVRLIVFRDIVTEDHVHIFVDVAIGSPISGKLSHSVNQLWQSEHRLPATYEEVEPILKELEQIVEVRGISLHYDNGFLGNYIRFVAQTDNKNGEIEKISKLLL